MAWRRFLHRARWDRDRAREVEAHIEFETAENIARGMGPEEARAAARRKLGNPTLIREEIYRMNTLGLIDSIGQDVAWCLRVLRKSPTFSAVAVLSLALGIGANTAIFSLVHAVLLRGLPFPQPERLLLIGHTGYKDDSVNLPEFAFFREHAQSFSSVAADSGTVSRLAAARDQNQWAETMPISTDFFRTLGVTPALGREFQPEETRAGGPRAVILTDSLWRHLFGADPQAPGRAVTLDETTFAVVGVLPPDFWFPQRVDAFVPLRASGTIADTGYNSEIIARLKPGVSMQQARAEMAPLTASYIRANPDQGKIRPFLGTRYQDWLVGDVRTNLLLLFGAVGLLLLIACTNLAGLLLARLSARQKEIALRIALGSSAGRMIRQFLTENLLLVAAGGLVGVLAAVWLLDSFVALIPFHLPAAGRIRVDFPVLAFTLAVALGTGLVFSIAPLAAVRRLNIFDGLRSSGHGMGSSSPRQRARGVLVVAEVALSVALLVSASLLIQSLYRVYHEPLGFNPHHLVTFFTPASPQQRRHPERIRLFDAALLERLRQIPGVRAAATASELPLVSGGNFPTEHVGHPDHSIGGMEIREVSPAYLEAMGIPVILGRSLTDRDTEQSPPVILVSETVARQWWGNASPLGDLVKVGSFRGRDFTEGAEKPRQVVGVVGDTKNKSAKSPARPTVYIPVAQTPWYDSGMNWVVRGDLPADFTTRLQHAIAEIAPAQRIDRIRPMDEIFASSVADSRFDAWLFGGLAAIALLMTAIGVYGLLAFSVARRTNEIGTRMALGAGRGDVMRMVLRQGAGLLAAGLVIGLAGALAVSRSLTKLLFGVQPTDPLSFLAVAAILIAVGLLASYFPARRATKVDPVIALKYE